MSSVTVLIGEQGSAKSTITAVVRRLVDPIRVDPLKEVLLHSSTQPDLLARAKDSRLITMENISDVPAWLSDGICTLATGAGDSRHRNFSDGDEVTLNASRPVVLNGIGNFITRDDLRDRAVMIECSPIGPFQRKDEASF
jgi:hypothetical protein